MRGNCFEGDPVTIKPETTPKSLHNRDPHGSLESQFEFLRTELIGLEGKLEKIEELFSPVLFFAPEGEEKGAPIPRPEPHCPLAEGVMECACHAARLNNRASLLIDRIAL